MELTAEQIEKAVEFWGACLGRYGGARETSQHEMGGTMDLSAPMHIDSLTHDQRARFKEKLRYLLEHYTETQDYALRDERESILLEVDRHAEYLLAEAVRAAKLDPRDFLFPVQTYVCLTRDGRVFAREGCGGIRREL